MHTPARGVVTAGLRGRGRGLLGLDWPLVLGQEEVDAASDHDERGDTTDGDAGDRACGEVVVVALGRRRRRREERHLRSKDARAEVQLAPGGRCERTGSGRSQAGRTAAIVGAASTVTPSAAVAAAGVARTAAMVVVSVAISASLAAMMTKSSITEPAVTVTVTLSHATLAIAAMAHSRSAFLASS